MNEKILCVDDDINVLAALQRQLRKQFDIVGAFGAEKALREIAERGPFAVIVSDFQMPGMNGVDFLSKVRAKSPDSIRILFTGRADLNTAVAAVNEGRIFRFLTKPCPPEVMADTLSAAISQYRLVLTEKDLLAKTLRGSVQVLTEILAMTHPIVFSRANRVRECVSHLAVSVGEADNKWQLEVAAMLSQIGCIAVSEEVLAKAFAGKKLSEEEQRMYASHPATGGRLIASIPRLETVSQMVAMQQIPFNEFPADVDPEGGRAALGAQVLKAALDFDQCLSRGLTHSAAHQELCSRREQYNPTILEAIETLGLLAAKLERRSVRGKDLQAGMIAAEDIYSNNGSILLAKDQDLSAPVVEALRRTAAGIGIREPIAVLAPMKRAATVPAL